MSFIGVKKTYMTLFDTVTKYFLGHEKAWSGSKSRLDPDTATD
jgi:hypothetical protein